LKPGGPSPHPGRLIINPGIVITIISESPSPCHGIRNWLAETFPIAVNRFECLSWFNGVLLSGEVRLLKPDRRIFEIFLDTFRIEPSRAIYIDDRSENVEAAIELGMCGIVFRDSRALRAELTRARVIVD